MDDQPNADHECEICKNIIIPCKCLKDEPLRPYVPCENCNGGGTVLTKMGCGYGSTRCPKCSGSGRASNQPKDQQSPEAKLSELRSQVSVLAQELQSAATEDMRHKIEGRMFDWFDEIVDAAKESVTQ